MTLLTLVNGLGGVISLPCFGAAQVLQTVAEGKGELYCAQACFAVVSPMVWKGMI